MLSVADVRRWNPAELEATFRRLGAARDRLLESDADLRATRPPAGWQGAAADAARGEHDRLAEHLRRIVAGISAARPALGDAIHAVTALRADLATADALAADRGFTIGPDGTVTDTRQTVVPLAEVVAHQKQPIRSQAEIVDLLDTVLTRATTVDTELVRVLRRAAAEQIDDGAGDTLAGAAATGAGGPLPAPPSPDAAPAANTEWWNRLSPAEQERVLLEHPEWVGNLDGIPATIRDEANRARLEPEIDRVDRELAEATRRSTALLVDCHPLGRPDQHGGRERGSELSAARQLVERLTDQRAALTAVSAAIASDDRQLLLLDVSGHDAPRAAVASGNVDTANHVAVFTPGFTTTVSGSLVGYVNDMTDVRKTALGQLREAGQPDQTVATVAWLGYDAPQWDNVAVPGKSVLLPFDAARAGSDLARFYDGITAGRPTDPHLTALGHSYGSTTTGFALRQTAAADDAVLFGSPGSGFGVTDLKVPPGHLAVVEADWDLIADSGLFGGDPNMQPGLVNLSARSATAPDGSSLTGSTGHSDYLLHGSTSQYNIAATVAGLPDRRIVGPNVDLDDFVLAGVRMHM